MESQNVPKVLREIADACGGKITEVSGPLSDGSGFATMSMPLPETHWIYGADKTESYGKFNTPPMVLRTGASEKAMIVFGDDVATVTRVLRARQLLGTDPNPRNVTVTKRELAEMIRLAGKYAVRCATMNGKEMDFDPDALLQNLVIGFLGYWTDDGIDHDDDWANPPHLQKAK